MLKFILSLLLFCFFSFAHPFYLSVCDLKYNAAENALQGTVKLFLTDLEDALAKINHKRTDLTNAKDDASTRLVLSNYLANHLRISVNGNPLKINVLGFENEEEAIWTYVELKNCPQPEKVVISNKILCDYLPQQMNIVHLQVNSLVKSLKSGCEDPLLQFEF